MADTDRHAPENPWADILDRLALLEQETQHIVTFLRHPSPDLPPAEAGKAANLLEQSRVGILRVFGLLRHLDQASAALDRRLRPVAYGVDLAAPEEPPPALDAPDLILTADAEGCVEIATHAGTVKVHIDGMRAGGQVRIPQRVIDEFVADVSRWGMGGGGFSMGVPPSALLPE